MEWNLAQLDAKAPRRGKANAEPWAGGSWAMNEGLIARRYADPEFEALSTFREKYEYVQRHPLSKTQVDKLSPAEKYDLLVGDTSATLTQAIWREAKSYADKNTLEDWIGICEGVAAASVHYREPVHSVTLVNPQGIKIVFHALDIKALASLLWSSYDQKLPIAGRRCDEETDSACFDPNPGSLHIALLNMLGIGRNPIIGDMSPDSEVWNEPITAYELTYFNRKNGASVSRLEQALVDPATWKDDPYKVLRSPGTRAIVGVSLVLHHAEGTEAPQDSSKLAPIATTGLQYDLELDESGRVIGGEWISGDHPDFFWTVPQSLRGDTLGDRLLGPEASWSSGPVPAEWAQPIQLSAKKLQPLSKIVNRLVELSVSK